MTDADLLDFVEEFRDGILDGRPSAFMCFMVCAPLAPLLRCCGVEVELAKTEIGEGGHFWLKLGDGRALDPTADQFVSDLAPVYLGRPLAFHRTTPPEPETER